VAGTANARDASGIAIDESSFVGEAAYAIHVDNDLFSGAHRDQDYSWGGAMTFSSPRPGPLLAPLHRPRGFLDRWLMPHESDRRGLALQHQATQMGILAMTPQTLRSADPLYADRPFASLLFVTSSELQVLDDGDRARFSSFTVGMSACTRRKSFIAACMRSSEMSSHWAGTTRSPQVASQRLATSKRGSGS
jgi:hypothetical protein